MAGDSRQAVIEAMEAGKHRPSTPIDSGELCRRQQATSQWFARLRDRICAEFEAIEAEYATNTDGNAGDARFEKKDWHRDSGSGSDSGGGGGVMALMRGTVFEKVGVNISTVEGAFSPEFRGQIPGTTDTPEFWASGISLVAHPQNPFVPTVHINTRYLNTGGEVGGKRWFGGGADLTPTMPFDEDTAAFHNALKSACDTYNPRCYQPYKDWCDAYFHLPHRGEPRGVGGIFYDYLDAGDFAAEFAFTQSVGEAFLDIYPTLVRRRMHTPYTATDKNQQLHRRGRYVEFNLLYDRGTLFGLKTGGNVEAILMSLPPEARW